MSFYFDGCDFDDYGDDDGDGVDGFGADFGGFDAVAPVAAAAGAN